MAYRFAAPPLTIIIIWHAWHTIPFPLRRAGTWLPSAPHTTDQRLSAAPPLSRPASVSAGALTPLSSPSG